MKKFFLTLFLVAGAFSAQLSAQNPARLILWHRDGTQTRVELYTRPSVRVTKDSVIVSSPIVTLKYTASTVLRFTYENIPDGIETVEKDDAFRKASGKLFFSGAAKPSQVRLYGVDGRQYPINVQETNGGLTLLLSGIPAGVYILKVNDKTCKFEKK